MKNGGPKWVWSGAGLGALAAGFGLIVVVGALALPVFGSVLDLLIWVAAGLLAPVALGWALYGLAALVRALPRRFAWSFSGAALAAGILLALTFGFGLSAALTKTWAVALGAAAGLAFVILQAGVGAALALIFAPPHTRLRIASGLGLLIVLGAANLVGLTWVASSGSSWYLADTPFPGPGASLLQVSDPSAPGSYQIQSLFYGSGDDARRPEFGKWAALKTGPVDGSAFITGWKPTRTWFWGFDPEHLPLNGRVWYPQGEGPFPLFVMVHGNHRMNQYSDPGYAYLGELLASRGIIFVSVDENFLNGGPVLYGDLRDENDARAWLLLQHLALWRSWASDPASPFYQKVDMQRIAVGGHSRGGEAAAVAAVFNRLPRYPDNAGVVFNFDFAIRAVVAVAPTDGQYRPSGKKPVLEGVSYLVLHGSHDGDVSSFTGARQFERTALEGEAYHFKSAIYIDRANHGQFNTAWGVRDRSVPAAWLLNVRPLLSGEQQRQAAKVFISAFLDVTLKDNDETLPLFMDLRQAAAWLPSTNYLSRFEDSTFQMLAGFDEDLNIHTATLAGGRLAGVGLSVWQEKMLAMAPSEYGSQESSTVVLGWRRSGSDSPRYSLTLPGEAQTRLGLEAGQALVFSLANLSQENQALDLTVRLVDAQGQAAGLPLSGLGLPPQALLRRFTQLAWIEKPKAEPVLQTYIVPLDAFWQANPAFDAGSLAEIQWVFDRSENGLAALDQVGFIWVRQAPDP